MNQRRMISRWIMEMKSILIESQVRKKRAEKKALQDQQILENSQIEESAPEEFDVSTMQKTKLKKECLLQCR